MCVVIGTSMLAWFGLIATCRSDFFDLDPPPKPASNWTVEDARAFDAFPLYWLGDTYQGLQLTSTRFTADSDGVRHASFNYGEPSYYGDALSGSWQSPLEIDIQRYCGFAPEEYLSYGHDYNDGKLSEVTVRGVRGYLQRYRYGWTYLVLWTGGSTIYISGTPKNEADIVTAANDLLAIDDDVVGELRPLQPPTVTSC